MDKYASTIKMAGWLFYHFKFLEVGSQITRNTFTSFFPHFIILWTNVLRWKLIFLSVWRTCSLTDTQKLLPHSRKTKSVGIFLCLAFIIWRSQTRSVQTSTPLQGPHINNNLLGVLLKFRREPVAIRADIQHMFHCFLVKGSQSFLALSLVSRQWPR